MARTKSTGRLAPDADPAVRRRLEIMVVRARRVRPRRANRAPDSPAPAPTTVVDTLFTEGVSPTREGEGGRGEPPEVRSGIGTGVSGATADEPPGFARPTAIAGPSGTKRKKSTAEAHNNWVKHGWWITERTYFVGHQYVGPGRVDLRIDQTEAFRRQMEHRLCNR